MLKSKNAGATATATPYIGRTTLYGTTYYIHSYNGKLLAEYDSTGVCQKDYIYMGNKLIAEYQPVIAKYYYYASDQINSTRIITLTVIRCLCLSRNFFYSNKLIMVYDYLTNNYKVIIL